MISKSKPPAAQSSASGFSLRIERRGTVNQTVETRRDALLEPRRALPFFQRGRLTAKAHTRDARRRVVGMTIALPSPAVERYLFGFFSIGCLLAGYSVGSSNVTLSQQCAGQFSEDADPDTESRLIAANCVGALAGCLLLMRLGDTLGRRRIIRASAHAFLAGSLLTAGCPCPGQRGSMGPPPRGSVLAFLWGLGGALNFQATSQYVAEVMSHETRILPSAPPGRRRG